MKMTATWQDFEKIDMRQWHSSGDFADQFFQ